MGNRILLVDDAMFMRAVLKNILVGGGYDIVGEACNGLTGVQQYKELAPDLAILDITMEELDGLDATKLIKEYDPNAKILVCSAMIGQRLIQEEALEAGALDVIAKPFKKEQVLEIVDRILK